LGFTGCFLATSARANGVAAEVWAWTTTHEVLTAGNCALVNAPRPDAGMPTIQALPNTFGDLPRSSVFGGLPPSVMGSCASHNGTLLPCQPQPLSASVSFVTLDIVPRNVEKCIDTREVAVAGRAAECDPNTSRLQNPNLRIPIYAPLSGCAIRDPGDNFTVIIEFDRDNTGYTQGCSATQIQKESKRYQIVLTHIIADSAITSVRYKAIHPNPNVNLPNSPLREIGKLCARAD
jgi:hypothetical protein